MRALSVYFRAFKGKKLFLLYRDKVQADLEDELRARGVLENCSDDTVLDFVDHKTEHLVLMFKDEQRFELISRGIDIKTADEIIIPRLATELKKWARTLGPLESLSCTAQQLKRGVDQAFLERIDYLLDENTHEYTSGLLKTLALLASWAPEDEVTEGHRLLRAELVAKAEIITNRVLSIAHSPNLNTESARKEYVEFIWSCFDLALCNDLRLGRIVLGIGARLVRPE